MDNEELAEEHAAGSEDDGGHEYDIDEIETEDLDGAMREALEAVERSREHLVDAAAPEAAGGDAAGGEAVDELSEIEAELAELRNRSVRTLADFDNYRKRVARERHEEKRYAAADLANDMLAVVDNLERALDAGGGAEELKQGVAMIHKQLVAALGRHGVERVAALGEPFDPALHEAVVRIEEPGLGEPRVRGELQSGYRLYDRLLRPSMVKVAVPPAVPPAADEAGEPETD